MPSGVMHAQGVGVGGKTPQSLFFFAFSFSLRLRSVHSTKTYKKDRLLFSSTDELCSFECFFLVYFLNPHESLCLLA